MGKITHFPEMHRKAIEAWVAGKDIQWKGLHARDWIDITSSPVWNENYQYRIKPKAVKVYKVVFLDRDGKFILSDGWYQSLEDFNAHANMNVTPVVLVKETGKVIEIND